MTFHVGDRVFLKPGAVEAAMLGTIVAVVEQSRYDIEINDELWRGWYPEYISLADVPPSLDPVDLEEWLSA